MESLFFKSDKNRAKWVEPVKVELKNKQMLYSIPPPGSGVLAAYILNILDTYQNEGESRPEDTDPLFYHRMTEAFKHAFAQRTKLADPDYQPEVIEVCIKKLIETNARIELKFCSSWPRI